MTPALSTEPDLAIHTDALLAALDDALAPWFVAAWRSRCAEPADPPADATRAFHDATMSEVRTLLVLDIDAQPTGPLDVIRRNAIGGLTPLLGALGVPRPQRDEMDERINPTDVYAVAPASWAEFGPEVAEAGIGWGAAKAFVHLRRHRPADQT